MYRADVPGHFWPKLMGFLLLPAAGSLATRLAAPIAGNLAKSANPQTVAATVGALADAAIAYYAYKASEDSSSVGAQAFARGGMWGSMIAASFLAATPIVFDGTPMPAVSGVKNPLADKAFGLLTAQAAGAVAAKRVAAARGQLGR